MSSGTAKDALIQSVTQEEQVTDLANSPLEADIQEEGVEENSMKTAIFPVRTEAEESRASSDAIPENGSGAGAMKAHLQQLLSAAEEREICAKADSSSADKIAVPEKNCLQTKRQRGRPRKVETVSVKQQEEQTLSETAVGSRVRRKKLCQCEGCNN